MKIELPDGLVCKWCSEPSVDLLDIWVPHERQGFILVVMHCTWCNALMESMFLIHDDVICTTPGQKWRSAHNVVSQWPYGAKVKIGYRKPEDDQD